LYRCEQHQLKLGDTPSGQIHIA